MIQKNAYVGQEVIWVRKSPWGPLRCRITGLYTVGARVGFHQQSYDLLKNNHWTERDASVRRLLPDFGQRLSPTELEQQLKLCNKKEKYNAR